MASIGPDNKTLLEAQFDPDSLYSLTPRQIVDATMTAHGTTSAEDLKKYVHRCTSLALKVLADVERHMNAFLLASEKLIKSGQPREDPPMSILRPSSKNSRASLRSVCLCLHSTPNILLWLRRIWLDYFRASRPSFRIFWPNRLLPRSLAQLSHLQPKKQK
jgi:hypothetical protein